MTATIEIPRALRPHAGGLPELRTDAATVGDALATLVAAYPQLARFLYAENGALRGSVNVYVNDADVRALGGDRAPLGPGDRVIIVPSIAGGLPRGAGATAR